MRQKIYLTLSFVLLMAFCQVGVAEGMRKRPGKVKAKAGQKAPKKTIRPQPVRAREEDPPPVVAPVTSAPPKPSAMSSERVGAQQESSPDSRFYPYRFNPYLGLTVVRQVAFNVGAQFGFAPTAGSPFYVGPEINFSLFSPGSLLSVMGSFWYEVGISGAPRLGIVAGAAGGAGFSSGLAGVSTVTPMIFLDLGLTQRIDDLASVWARFRPGMTGGSFAFMMIVSVSFRFL